MSDGTINFPVRATPPATPAAGRLKFWADSTTKVPFYTDDAGISKSIAPPSSPIRLSYNRNTKTTSGTYEILAFFGFDGTTELGVPTKILAVAQMTGATDYSIRVFDETNSLVIAELTGQTNTVPSIVNLGSLTNLPTGPAVFSIQMLRTGTGSQSAGINAMSIKF